MTDWPTWRQSPLFPGTESPEFQGALTTLRELMGDLVAFFDDKGIGSSTPPELLQEAMQRYCQVSDALLPVRGELQMRVTTDSRDEAAQSKTSELNRTASTMATLMTRLQRSVGLASPEALNGAFFGSHGFFLEKSRDASVHQLSPGEEELAAELDLSAGTAWSRLHGDVSSQLLATLTVGGQSKTLPIAEVRNLARSADRQVRMEAQRAEEQAWSSVEVPLAAAINSIKGQVNTLCRRRSWPNPLAQSLHQNNIDQATLQALQQACQEAAPRFRGYLEAKAALLGLPKLRFCDLLAPLGEDQRTWDYPEAEAFIVRNFRSFSERLGAFAEQAFAQNWIDVPPRPGKRGGAFCMAVRPGESRILLNYSTDLDSVATLAHELGHGYHNLQLKARSALQRQTPMTLAETASIFCETLTMDQALREVSGAAKLHLLDTWLQGETQVVVDIHSRFLFEQELFSRRQDHELSARELCELMEQCQLQSYGPVLERGNSYAWAAKVHYYSSGRSFYNYPYTFGLLFGLGLYAEYQNHPGGFPERYDRLLSETGMYSAADLAKRSFGLDIRDSAFWGRSLEIIGQQIDALLELASQARA
jgi:pepF/M3 family oligoendopeptidase